MPLEWRPPSPLDASCRCPRPNHGRMQRLFPGPLHTSHTCYHSETYPGSGQGRSARPAPRKRRRHRRCTVVSFMVLTVLGLSLVRRLLPQTQCLLLRWPGGLFKRIAKEEDRQHRLRLRTEQSLADVRHNIQKCVVILPLFAPRHRPHFSPLALRLPAGCVPPPCVVLETVCAMSSALCRPQPQSVFGFSCRSSIWGKLFFHCRQVLASVAREAMKAPTLG